MSAPTPVIGPTDAPALHVMSYNVRRRLPFTVPADRWARRRPLAQALLRSERPTILGAQEVLPDQADALAAALGDSYRFVGYGRGADRTGEASPIFYDADRLELRAWDQRALSDSPAVAGSRGWGNLFPRVMVVARWRDHATGGEVRMLNTHLDPFSARSRARSLDALGRAAAGEVPTILTGDLNMSVASAAPSLSAAGLTDTWLLARERRTPEWRTLATYRAPRPGARIDVVAVSSGFEVEAVAIQGTPVDGRWPSDHLPVQALLRPSEGPR